MLDVILGILNECWIIVAEAAPWLLVGFVVAGLLQVLDLIQRFKKSFTGSGMRSVLMSTFIGMPLPLCSCSVIPLIHTMKKSGASKGATASFMTSTPQIGVDSYFLTQGLFGSPMALLRVCFAFVTAIIAGISMRLLPHEEISDEAIDPTSDCCSPVVTPVHSCCHSDPLPNSHAHSTAPITRSWSDMLKGCLHFAFVDLPKELSGLLLLGFFLSGIISYVLPSDFIGNYLGNPYLQIAFATLFSVPIYVCATSSTPVAATLVLKGLAPSAALVFLLAGPATNISTMLIARKTLGNAGALLYIFVIVTVSLLAGFGIEAVSAEWGVNVLSAHVHVHEHDSLVHTIAGIFILVLLAIPWLRSHSHDHGHEGCCTAG